MKNENLLSLNDLKSRLLKMEQYATKFERVFKRDTGFNIGRMMITKDAQKLDH